MQKNVVQKFVSQDIPRNWRPGEFWLTQLSGPVLLCIQGEYLSMGDTWHFFRHKYIKFLYEHFLNIFHFSYFSFPIFLFGALMNKTHVMQHVQHFTAYFKESYRGVIIFIWFFSFFHFSFPSTYIWSFSE